MNLFPDKAAQGLQSVKAFGLLAGIQMAHPARLVNICASQITPEDYRAVAEVYLDSTWHLVDATGMAAANQIGNIGVGFDSAEVSFFSSFGQVSLQNESVQVTVIA